MKKKARLLMAGGIFIIVCALALLIVTIGMGEIILAAVNVIILYVGIAIVAINYNLLTEKDEA